MTCSITYVTSTATSAIVFRKCKHLKKFKKIDKMALCKKIINLKVILFY